MANKPSILSTFKKGQSLGAIDHLDETMNWLIGFVSNLKCEKGLTLKNEKSDHPIMEANIIAGEGITIKESNGGLEISVKKQNDDDDDGDGSGGGGGRGGKKGSGGSGSGGSGGAGSGSGGSGGATGGGGGGSGGSGTGGSGSGSGGSGSGNGTSCNEFSDDPPNDNSDDGMNNFGDDCKELNGW